VAFWENPAKKAAGKSFRKEATSLASLAEVTQWQNSFFRDSPRITSKSGYGFMAE
jgi:hypothetical protein